MIETLASPVDFDGWRVRARALLLRGVPPEDVAWRVVGDDEPLPLERDGPTAPGREICIPRRLLNWPISRSDIAIPALRQLYRLLTRLAEEPRLLEAATDPDVARSTRWSNRCRATAIK